MEISLSPVVMIEPANFGIPILVILSTPSKDIKTQSIAWLLMFLTAIRYAQAPLITQPRYGIQSQEN